MSKRLRQIIQAIVFTVLIAVGIGLVSRWDLSLIPMDREAAHLLRAAAETEYIALSQWPAGVAAPLSPFHQASGICARFFGEGQRCLPIRCYRVFPSILSILFLMALPALGLRRRSGIFESADGPLWALAFAVISPAVVWDGGCFTPFSFLLLCFLSFLLAARSYAQWPGFPSAVSAGAVLAVLTALDANALWLIAVLLPTVAVGVGWRRLRLYWRTVHFLAALAVAAALVLLFSVLSVTRRPTVPSLPPISAEWGATLLQDLLWVTAGGLGILAWIALTIFGGFRPDRRWIRLLTLLFPCCVIAAALFPYGTLFWGAVAVLTPVMIGVMLSEVPNVRLRAIQGIVLWGGLAGWTWLVLAGKAAELPTRAGAYETVSTLAAAQESPRLNACRLRIHAADTATLAQVIWPIRHTPGPVEQGGEHIGADADIILVPEALAETVPRGIQIYRRPGRVSTDSTTRYCVFAAPGAEESSK